ncbi:non-ribosomal peptide synthetase/type I polyketide synthase [Dictyobacter formicarum]|uniref:Non-ribosomal peptide synthetase n=1 Tax=Dictyobacter formicarum TaxID=2778368 RepID=A0ABQ3VAE3_9CHLR|nr:non-ribosomal peptide synthetase/type I polyketide synthase [Dictyobacter formicarum]GHO82466.1 hypothetical protein KSZ_04720 [Dictyobacter formicarum]
MSGLDHPLEQLSLLKRSVLALERMQAKLDHYELRAQIEDPSITYQTLLGLSEHAVLDHLNTFISDHEQLSPLKRAVVALERMQERLIQREKTSSLAYQKDGNATNHFTTAKEEPPSTLLPPPLMARTSQEQIPLSFAQQRLWFIERLNPENSLYNESCAIYIQGQLNLEAMEQALGAITQRHEILRTSFPVRNGTAIQYVHPWQPFKLIAIDLHSIAASQRLPQVKQLAEDEVRHPFDVAHGPLVRSRLYQLAKDEALFLVVVHHLVADGWSMGIFFRELSTFYSAFCRGDAPSLAPLPLQYADYTVWQQQWLQGDVLKEKLAYWENLLAGAPQILELPTDRLRPAVQTYQGAHVPFILPDPLVDALRTLGQQVDATLYTILLAAFQVLLWCYTEQDDMLIGTPMINRGEAQIENLIGFFVNTLVLRADLSGNPTFLVFIERVSKAVLAALAQQDVPFDRLVTALLPQRDLSHSPLFQVVFSMHQASWMNAKLAGLTTSPAFLGNGRARVDLTFEIIEGDGKVEGNVEYSTDLFDKTSIDRLLKHWFTILEHIAATPQYHLTEIAMLSQAEQEQILVEWNKTASEYEVLPIHKIFEQVASTRSESIAVVFEDMHITYRELHHRSNQLANFLTQQGIGPEQRVGICVERSLDMLIAVLGVLKAGAAYVPLDPAYPNERLKFLLEDAELSLLLTQEHLAKQLLISDIQVICLDTGWQSIIATPLANTSVQVSPHNLAYIIYTSGSTGVPKGVMVEHWGLNNLAQAQIQFLDLKANSHVLQFSSFGFDAWVFEVFATLLANATLYLGSKETLLPGASLLQTMESLAITSVTLPPTALSALPYAELPHLQTIVSAGEACTVELISLWSVGRRFINAYGPTEATVCATIMPCSPDMSHPPIGHPINNTQIYLLNAALQPVPVGVPGEVYIGGAGLARGYLYRPEITAAAFLPHPFSDTPGARLYRTGDVARYQSDGTLEFLGRVDHQVKVRGFRIELGEIETVLALHPAVRECVVVVREDTPTDKRIIAYIVTKEHITLSASEAYTFLKERLPDYFIPSAFVQLSALPLNPHGKVDRKALPDPEAVRPALDAAYIAPRTRIEHIITEIWQEELQMEEIGLDDNFFELGGHSLIMAQVHTKLCERLQIDIKMVDLFEYPTIRALIEYLQPEEAHVEVSPADQHQMRKEPGAPVPSSSDIAIIGMAGRFPGARDIDEFWRNIQEGKESVTFFTQEELLSAGVDPALLGDKHYVPAGALLEDAEWFDASFFGYTPREAEIIDPQQRIFLECAWQALEDAGYNADGYDGRIAVFGGATNSTYFARNLLSNAALDGTVDQYQMMLGNSTDFLTSRVAYKLNLRGPAVTVLTACSTSLVAVHMACESLRTGKCDMALAGGVSVRFPQKIGYFYREGGIMSPDGHCRVFDKDAKGIVGGEGVGIVVVKRLADALADGDTIQAVIRGSAINNDGAQKVGYTAPGVQGQAAVITEAFSSSGIDPQTIRYIEAHGTGTPIGDPIEVAALQQAYGSHITAGQCALGSVKSNIGHLDAAAGVAGLIKTVKMLNQHMLPPSLHVVTPNPALNLEQSAFYINRTLSPWETDGSPRRAGISSFGIGGTNAHIILEEPPISVPAAAPASQSHLLVLSARTETALQQARINLVQYLQQHPELELADVAYTLQIGRKPFNHRSALVCRSLSDAIQMLESSDPTQLLTAAGEASSRSVVFMFPGQGAQYSNMARELYHTEAVFRAEINRCAELLEPSLGLDLRSVLYPDEAEAESARLRLNQTQLTQPALFVVEYALAQLWLHWGVTPAAMIGHSIGEYVAACLAGVFSLEDALRLVALRGRLMQQLPPGTMLAVSLPPTEIRPFLNERLSLAAINTPEQCVVSGTQEDIEEFIQTISEQGAFYSHLHTSHAFHSSMVEPIIKSFVEEVAQFSLHAPQLPYISNVSGTWISQDQATDPGYWGQHLREMVRFADGVSTLFQEKDRVFLEVGPGRTLGTFVKAQQSRMGGDTQGALIAASLPHAKGAKNSDQAFILASVGRLWLSRVSIAWENLSGDQHRRIPLPTYPFERKRYCIENSTQTVTHHAIPNQSENEGNSLQQETQEAVEQAQQNATIAETPPDTTTTTAQHDRPQLPAVYKAPRNELEQSMVSIWQQFFGINGIGIDDGFFDLGGDSLLAVQVLSQLHTLLHVDLTLQDFFTAGTIAGIARCIESLRQPQMQVAIQELEPEPPVVDAPLSFMQRRLWFLDRLEPGNPILNISLAIRIQGPLNLVQMDQCLQEIIRRQAALRTYFVEIDGEPVQRIMPSLRVPLPLIDLHGLPAHKQESKLTDYIAKEARRPFDLSQAPLLRTTIIRLHRPDYSQHQQEEHVLLLNMHHAISDGWSMGVFLNEFSALYTAFMHGQSSPLPALTTQYVDFATWQLAQDAALEQHLHYWRDKLGGDLPVLELPTDYPRPTTPAYRGARQRLLLPGTLLRDLKLLSQREGVTFFMTLLGAFQLLLSRYSGQEDILVGTPVANRNNNDIEPIIGPFVDILVLRTDLSGDPTFQELLGRIREVCLQAYAHQGVPFDILVETLNPQRDTSRAPLIQVLLRLPNAPMAPISVADLTLNVLPMNVETADQDLTLDMIELPDSIEATIEYHTALFAPATIERLLRHWQTLLEAIVSNPQARLSQLPLLTSAESRLIQTEWNSPHIKFPDDHSPIFVHELFEQQVAQTPDAIAISLEHTQLSYRELNRKANQLARYLQTQEVGPEVLVGVCMERSLEMIIGMLGVLKAGGTYVPLDPDYPEDRLVFILEDAQISRLIVQEQSRHALPAHSTGQEIILERDWSQIANQHEENLKQTNDINTLAYIIYTSGSTGQPKGVLVSHAGIVNLVEAQTHTFGVQASDHILQFASTSFDAAISEMFMALCMGARLCLARSESLLPGQPLVELLTEQHISLITLPPSALTVIEPQAVPDLQTIIVAGEPCPANVMQRWITGRNFFNAYGPTESTVCATIATCTEQMTEQPPIGRPISHTQVYILDTHLNLVPVGVVGQLYIGSRGLARGYLKQPGLTASTFIPHPFSAEPGMRLYKTGDRARYLPDGTIDFLSRIDQQVKVRGYRIELGEIETVLGQHPGVRECAVVVQAEQWEDKRLVACVVGRDGVPDIVELRQHLRQFLPEYMLPGIFLILEALPLSANGKIDRRALAALQPVETVTEDENYGAPRTMVEELVINILADILQLERISTQDNFFEIGGHSLLGAQVIARIRQALGVEVPIYTLFETETTGEFCAVVEEALRTEQGVKLPPLEPTEHRGKAPLSFAQQRMWFLDQLQPGNTFYTIIAPFKIKGPLHIEALEKSVHEIVRRHEILRTTFIMLEEEPYQIIAPALHVPFPIIDLSGLSENVRKTELRRQVEMEAHQAFHLARGPLFRACVFHTEIQSHVLLLTFHNSISDGWSRGVVVHELSTLYDDFRTGENLRLPELPVQYADFALWQRQWLQGEILDAQSAYWLQHLAGAPTHLELPTDRPRPAIQTYRGGHQAIFISDAITQALENLSQEQGCTLFMIVLTAFLTLLFRYSGQEDIVIGTPVAGRNTVELEGLIGFFANTLALRTDLSDNPTFLELLQRVRKVALGAYTHQDLPFEKLVEIVQPERSLSHSPLFQVMFTLQDDPNMAKESTWLAPAELEIETETAKFDLNLFLNHGRHGLEGVIEYNTDLFDRATITSLVDHWHTLLKGIIDTPHERLASLPVMSEQEQQLLLNKLAQNRTYDVESHPPRQITVTATFTAETLEEPLAWWSHELNWPTEVHFAPYQQLFQQLLDADSLIQRNHDGVNILLVRFEDWLRIIDDTSDGRVAIEYRPESPAKVERNVQDLARVLMNAAQQNTVPHLLCICPPSPAILNNEVYQELFNNMEQILSSELSSSDGVHVITSTEIAEMYPVDVSYDPVSDEAGHIPYTPEFFTALGTFIIRKIAALYRRPYKVIAVDCDNTLWKGVCGEDGAMGVELSAPYLDLQRFLVAQQEAGMLICLCSKNNMSDVLDVFAKRPEMPLQLKHLVANHINWQAKSQNLLELARELQLGMDSFIFIDDNPLECAEVQQYCPQVFTLLLPPETTQWSEYLKHIWLFDHLRLTQEDRKRTEMYQQNSARLRLQQEAPTFKEFLAGLELEIHINPIGESHLARVAQLTQRTNQFNTTMRRYSANEITHYLSKPGQEGLVVEVSDRFGDYGKVGVMLFALHDEALVVDTFLMSCRSMGRGVEHRMLAYLGMRAQKMGLQRVLIPFQPSEKNKPALDFLEQVQTESKQADANGVITYDFSSASLVNLSYPLLEETAVPAIENDNIPRNEDVAQAKQATDAITIPGPMQIVPQDILRIAHELSSAERVLQIIRRWKKRPVDSVPPQDMAQSRTETHLAELWQQLLHLERVSIHDSFFGLGGHSLLATQLLSRIATTFGIRLPLQVIFEKPTIAQQAEQIDTILRDTDRLLVELPVIHHITGDEALPLSFAQQRLWFLDQLAPGNPSYNIPLRIRLQGTLDIAALQLSLQEIVQRHAILRTTFLNRENNILQVITPTLTLSMPVVDLQSLPLEVRHNKILPLLKEQWQAIFNLEHGPLLRMMVLKVDVEEAILAITLHHIIFDAWSAGVLSRELVALYTAFKEKRVSPLAPLPIQYADFALWQRSWLQGEVLHKLEIYWRERLRGAATLQLPGELPATGRHNFQGEHIPFALSPDLSTKLMILSQQEEVTLFMTLLAAFQTLLYRSTGQTDIVIGTDIANRTLGETEQLIGFFVNLLVLRTDLSNQPTFRELLQRVRDDVLKAYAHQDLPFEKLVEAVQIDRKLNHAPLIRVLFVLQNTPLVPMTLPDLTISPVEMEVDTVNFDIVIFLYEDPQGIRGVLHYSADVCDAKVMQQLVEQFLILLAGLPEHCDALLDTLAIYSESEQKQRLLKEAAQQEEQRKKLNKFRRKSRSDQPSV